ncbi:GNAT family N-acetyltransferase [Paenibacillus sp. IHBB 10380]|uniref:GNAT family N-acetyltransferase n=1 Tax=Paenibacillus sp. IHBB 10380 TaxID=1566358 RepID=UPI0005CFA88A|nr:GNAT family N-acetyltransferase [Paenibacillus sp. IHBB 10380]AJS59011.1 GCN5 family acetyltransferase [Paenibacillus sp. IHBB 10380]
MRKIFLSRPIADLKNEYIDFYQEWKESGEDMVPWVISKGPEDFEEMMNWLFDNERGVNLPEGWVPDSTFWLVSEDNKIIGAVNIRHELTGFLMNRGGHIGYGIRPSERRKGYATKLLSLSLKEAKKLGIDKVLVVCDESNIASERTIISNGGISDNNFIEENGNVIKRYWINI